jgi:hypothetical protein
VLAKEWATERNHWLFAGGLVAFGALFAVYAVSLRLTELSTVTFGWIVTLVAMAQRRRSPAGAGAGASAAQNPPGANSSSTSSPKVPVSAARSRAV